MVVKTIEWCGLGVVMLVLVGALGCRQESALDTDEPTAIDSAPDNLGPWGGKADTGLGSVEGRRLNIGERFEGAFEQGITWASFELARDQSIQLSVEEASSLRAFVYGPIDHREAMPPSPEPFFRDGDELFVRGWERPTNVMFKASRGGHYLLVVVSQDTSRRGVAIETECVRGCLSRQRLDAELRTAIPDLRAYMLPARTDLNAIPHDQINPLNEAKVELGRRLFHNTKMATLARKEEGQSTYSCASCHNVHHGWGAGAPQGIGEGGLGGVFNEEGWSRRVIDERYDDEEIDAQPIASPTILNSAYLGTALWNGVLGLGDVVVPGAEPIRNPNVEFADKWKPGTPPYWSHLGFSGLETQAIVGLHVHRQSIVGSELARDSGTIELFERAFPQAEIDALQSVEDCYHALLPITFPETYFSAREQDSVPEGVDCEAALEPSPYRDDAVSDLKASLAIAAFERTVLATEAPFQIWLRESAERADVASSAMTLDELRGARVFFDAQLGNCARCHTGPALTDGAFHVMGLTDLIESDRSRVHTKLFEGEENGRGGWTGRDDLKYAFKTPQLYNLAQHSFFGHGSTHRTLESMVRYMVRGKKMVGFIGGDRPLAPAFTDRELSEGQIQDLVVFVSTGLFDPTLTEELPNVERDECLISSDSISSQEQGCDP